SVSHFFTDTLHSIIIYHSPLDSSHSSNIVSHEFTFLISHQKIISFAISIGIQEKIFNLKIFNFSILATFVLSIFFLIIYIFICLYITHMI
ncbi:MAG: hypothetical protein U9Q66_04135, partial [Patescibacteria group bacterium]|nr:hypothetical protein [Patescibacteria group bacterium]